MVLQGIAGVLLAQTQVTPVNQINRLARIDFSAAESTKPAKAGTTLPSTCSTGEVFFKTDAPAGSNLHGCTQQNTWAVQGAAGGGDFLVVRTNGTQLTVGADCSVATPCNVRFGTVTTTFREPATTTLSGGTGLALFYLDGSQTPPVLRVRHNGLAVACAGMGCGVENGTAFPLDAIPVFSWSAESGAWDATGTDLRAVLSHRRISTGTGLVSAEAGGQIVLAVDNAAIPQYLTAAASLDFPALEPGTCSEDLPLSLAGAIVGDAVAAGWPAALEGGLVGNMRVNAPDSVAVRLCNFSGAAVDPAAASFRATVVRGF